ncbi:Alpha-ketoglutarate-dependent dioxygenase alkB-like protein 7, mitochondrial [Frankliniella fusca]|uniref:Alpha-ketoglutarate-dependent dioxygenase alkB-like protein 7, mitochondrial n=1 Tax=Frankliniella fusca TaxID=407009 RepID=A0AAE1HL97_9NEOP|nr:Alpha-ketoglutarate-dependent dioxygenase alkB-like protein 7, mitochondrial [Frankliniella fusca]
MFGSKSLRLGPVVLLGQIAGQVKWATNVPCLQRVRFLSHLRQAGSDKIPLQTHYIKFSSALLPEECEALLKDMVVHDDFLSDVEEKIIFDEVEPYISRLHYEYDHWDNAIHGFRETERLHWTKPSSAILDRVRGIAFPEGKSQLKHVHVLDLSENGFIKPHIDSVKFCGDTIAGLSLLSDSVMRLVHDKDCNKIVDVLLKRRSLYVMRDSARYNYTHEILKKDASIFNDKVIPRHRRISVICRSEVTS